MRRLLYLLMASAIVTGCQRSTGGPLEPIRPTGSAEGKVELRDGQLLAEVAGRWSAAGSNTLRITYRNGGGSAARIAISRLRMVHPKGEAALRTALNVTGVDLSDQRSNNDDAQTLFSRDGGGGEFGTLLVPAGAAMSVDADLTAFSNDHTVSAGDRIVATIPLQTTDATIDYIARRP